MSNEPIAGTGAGGSRTNAPKRQKTLAGTGAGGSGTNGQEKQKSKQLITEKKRATRRKKMRSDRERGCFSSEEKTLQMILHSPSHLVLFTA
jgi:hypothetical protein